MKQSNKNASLHLVLPGVLSILLFLYPQSGSGTVLNVSEVFQEHDQWCWAGVSQAILQYYGTVLTQTNIAEYGTSGYNTWNYLYGSDSVDPYYRKGINMILTNWGLSCAYGEYTMSQEEVQDQIDSGRPFVIRWGWYSGGGHFVAGRGIETNIVHYMDPWPGNGYSSATYSWVVDDGTHSWTHTLEITSEFSSPPQAPTGLSASDGTYTDGIQVAWNSVTNATGYEVWRNTNDNTEAALLIAGVGGETTTNYDDVSAGYNTNYYYWTKATNSSGTSGFGESDSGYRGLSAPTGLSASDGTYADKVSVSWTAVSGATSYEIWRYTSDSSGSASKLDDASDATYDDSSASVGEMYYYWVKAKNSLCTSEFGSGDSGYRALSAPTSVSASDGTYSNKVQVTWIGSDGATSYEIWRSIANDTSSASKLDEVSATSYVEDPPWWDDTSAEAGTTYYYWIKAKNSLCVSAFSSGDSGHASEVLPPSPPTDVSASDGDYTDKVRVTWTESTGATGYEVWRHTSDSSGSASKLDDTSDTSYDDTSAVTGTVYYYWVKAINSTNCSTLSESDSGYISSSSGDGGDGTDGGDSATHNVSGDYDGDGKTDLALYHEASGYWYILNSSNSTTSSQKFGETGYDPVSGDFDGDGKSDLAVYHEETGYWYILLSGSSYSLSYMRLGASGYTPVSGDFDADGKTDVAVYRESTGYWYILKSSDYTMASTKWGASGYTPVPGDYDGDGTADLAVYCEQGDWPGYWYILKSSDYTMASTKWGASGYTPVPGDYDGDGITDLAVYCETGDYPGYWYILNSTDYSMSSMNLGASGYTPVPGDYDGDGTTDLTVYRESSGYWYILLSGSSYSLAYQKFGEPGYTPIGR